MYVVSYGALDQKLQEFNASHFYIHKSQQETELGIYNSYLPTFIDGFCCSSWSEITTTQCLTLVPTQIAKGNCSFVKLPFINIVLVLWLYVVSRQKLENPVCQTPATVQRTMEN